MVKMDKYIILDPKLFQQQSGKVYLQEYCGGWCIFFVWHWTAMWQGSIFGCFSQH